MSAELPVPSRLLLEWFTWYAERYVARSFHALRRSLAVPPPVPGEEPWVIYLNHPSWWDPLVGLLVADRYFAGRRHAAIIDAEAVGRYRFFERLGFIGVERQSRRGARRFLQAAEALLRVPRGTLWLTPQGEFVDARRRPLALEQGLGRLAVRYQDAIFLPLALEYTFWDERLPEALLRFAEPLPARELARLGPQRATSVLAARLEEAQDRLAAEATSRCPDAFEVLVGGREGVGGMYDLWRRLRARLAGETFRAAHAPVKRLEGGA